MLDIDLFEHIENSDILELLQCIGIKTKKFKKNSYILKTNSKIDFLGVIIDGKVLIKKTDHKGNSIEIDKLNINDIFGHNIVCCGLNKSPVDITAQTDCEVLFLPFEKVVTPCEKLCKYHIQLIKNVMKMVSKRNSILNNQIDIIGQKSIREKILAFLNTYKTEDKIFSVPYSREEMAKFLCTDRCALSRELSRMQKEGILRYKKNLFEILK